MPDDLFHTAGAAIALNPAAGTDYTPGMEAILNDTGFKQARSIIRHWPGYAETPLHGLPALAFRLGVSAIDYKDEGSRFGLGSFKALGGAYAVYRLLAERVRAATGSLPTITAMLKGDHRALLQAETVTCATDGNHGRSVAWGARLFGGRGVIFIHSGVSNGRRDAIAAYGAEVRRTEGNYDDSVRIAQQTADAEGWHVVSDTSYPGYRDIPRDVMQGYELMADEALSALSRPPTHLFLQTGVGGMAAAVAAHAWRRWSKSRPTIILADPERADCWYQSLSAGRPVAVTGDLDTLQAGLACGEVSDLAWEILHTGADAVVRVPDAAALAAMRVLARPFGSDPPIVAGESAVAGLAALAVILRDPASAEALHLDRGSRILVFGTEGDTDPALYQEIVGRPAEAVRHGAR